MEVKKKKSLLGIICTLFVVSALIVVSGCSSIAPSNNKYVVDIEKTSQGENGKTYTVVYSDGTSAEIVVENGLNGEDGQDGDDAEKLTVDELFEAYKKENPSATMTEFIKTMISDSAVDNSAAINKNLTSSLKVYAEFTEYVSSGIFRPSSQQQTGKTLFAGSAVIYKIETNYTYIITNYHVIYDANAVSSTSKISEDIHVYLYGSESAPIKNSTNGVTAFTYDDYAVSCEYVGGSVTSDIAILRANTADLKKVNDGIKAVTLADGYNVGETAIAIGNPQDEGISVTEGIISVDNEYISLSLDGTTRQYRSLRIDTPLYSGNSGGGLFNTDGNLIGITNAGNTEEENVNYAIPVSIVKSVADNIITYAKDNDSTTNNAYKITLGINVETKNSKYVYNETTGYGTIKEDIIIAKVETGSIAESLGLKVGDQITKVIIDDTSYQINRSFEISDSLFNIRNGSVLKVEYIDGTETKVSSSFTVASANLVAVA